jgi:hypothetical protein
MTTSEFVDTGISVVQNAEREGREDRNLGLIPLLLPAITAAFLIWLPFGTAMIGSIEEWGMLGLFSTHGVFFVAHPDGPVALHALRALMPSSFAAAYLLDPNSFGGWHVLQFVALIIKGVASSYLIWKATGSRFLAVVVGALVLVYPADTMQLSFRSLHINWSIALALLAAAIFVGSVDSVRRLSAYAGSVAAAVLFLAASCIYEAALTLVLVPLLILYVRSGLRDVTGLLRAKAEIVGIWFLGVGVYLAFAIWASKRVASYQQSLATGEGGILAIVAHSFSKLFTVGALRALLGGWVDAGRILSTEYSSYTYVVASALLFGALLMALFRLCEGGGKRSVASRITGTKSLRLAVAGTILVLMGYAPFLVSQPHLAISQRTFIWATPGAAMVWVAGIAWLWRGTRAGAGAAAVALLTLGLSAQLFQFHHYVNIAERQRALLRAVVENFDGDLNGKTLVILDGTNQLGHTWMFLNGLLSQALGYLYGHKIESIEMCHASGMEWQAADDLGRKGTCARDGQGWTFSYPAPVTTSGYAAAPLPAPRRVSDADAVVVTIRADGSVVADPALDSYRASLINGQGTIAARYRGVVKQHPWPLRFAMFRDQHPRDDFRWGFGDYWSLEIPTRGSGWREAEWEVGTFHHNAAAWKTREDAEIDFDFTPVADSYQLRAKFKTFAPAAKNEQLKLQVNEVDLNFHWIGDGELEAEISGKSLKAGANSIRLRLPIDLAYYGLSAQLDWIEIKRRD